MSRCLQILATSILLGAAVAAQSRPPIPEQSPRKALLEMLLGGDDALKKHLTLDVQKKMGASPGPTPGAVNPIQLMSLAKTAAGQNLETFEAGPVLFSYENQAQHQRFEVRIDGDDLRGSDDQMRLSIHSFRNGIEDELPVALRFTLSWKAQQNVWRLNAITMSATVPIGDPRIFDQARWTQPGLAAGGTAPATHSTPVSEVKASSVAQESVAEASALSTSISAAPPQPAASDASAQSSPAKASSGDAPKMAPARAIRRIVMAEDVYAQKHGGIGFTCFLSELVNVGRGFEDGEPYRFIDPELSQGVYNGYRFMLTACSGSPVKSFQVVAEPVSGTGRAYCSGPTHELRGSDDGHGATCLTSGKLVQR